MKKLLLAVAVTLAYALVLFVPRPASATILWAGGEDFEFTSIGGPAALDQTSGRFRSGYARGALKAVGTVSNGNFYNLFNVISQTSFWVHGRIWLQTGTSCTTCLIHLITLTDSTGVVRLAVDYGSNGLGTTGTPFTGGILGLRIQKWTAAAVSTNLGYMTYGFSSSPSAPDTFDFQVSSYGASCTINFYINGGLAFNYAGDCHTDSNTTINGLQLFAADFSSRIADYSEIIVSTTDTRSMGLATLAPAANGNTQAWSCTGGTNYGSVNEWTLDDTNNCHSSTGAQLEEFTVGSLPSGSYGIAALVENARSAVSTTGPQNLQFDVRTGGTSYQSSNVSPAPGTSFGLSSNVWSTNPNTSVGWTPGDLGAVGFNIGFESQN